MKNIDSSEENKDLINLENNEISPLFKYKCVSNDLNDSSIEKIKLDKESSPKSFTPDSVNNEMNFPEDTNYMDPTCKSDSFDRISVKDHVALIEEFEQRKTPVSRCQSPSALKIDTSSLHKYATISPLDDVTEKEQVAKLEDADVSEFKDSKDSFSDIIPVSL